MVGQEVLPPVCVQVQELRSSSSSTDARIQDLQQQLEDNAGFKDKVRAVQQPCSWGWWGRNKPAGGAVQQPCWWGCTTTLLVGLYNNPAGGLYNNPAGGAVQQPCWWGCTTTLLVGLYNNPAGGAVQQPCWWGCTTTLLVGLEQPAGGAVQ